MLATDVQPNRFEQAKADLDKLIDGLKGNDQLVLLLAAAHTEVKQSATTDKVALRRALAACAPEVRRAPATLPRGDGRADRRDERGPNRRVDAARLERGKRGSDRG